MSSHERKNRTTDPCTPMSKRASSGAAVRNMQTSQAGRQFVERQEGLVLKVYDDFRKPPQPTIGYGHALRPGEAYPNGITAGQADLLLLNDLRIAEACINAHVTVPLEQYQFDALVSLTFNEG